MYFVNSRYGTYRKFNLSALVLLTIYTSHLCMYSIGGVMVSVFTSSAVGYGFELWSGQTKVCKIGISCFLTRVLSCSFCDDGKTVYFFLFLILYEIEGPDRAFASKKLQVTLFYRLRAILFSHWSMSYTIIIFNTSHKCKTKNDNKIADP